MILRWALHIAAFDHPTMDVSVMVDVSLVR